MTRRLLNASERALRDMVLERDQHIASLQRDLDAARQALALQTKHAQRLAGMLTEWTGA